MGKFFTSCFAGRGWFELFLFTALQFLFAVFQKEWPCSDKVGAFLKADTPKVVVVSSIRSVLV